MNGYTMIAKGLKQLVEQGKIKKEEVERQIEVYEFLATCNNDDLCTLVDSSAFNDIIKAYMKKAITTLPTKEKTKIVDNLHWLFDEYTAKEILDDYIKTKNITE